MNPPETDHLQPEASEPSSGQTNMTKRRTPPVLLLAAILVVTTGGGWLVAQGFRSTQGPQPTFGPLTASPPNLVFNTPTDVTFTIGIPTPTVNPTTVELQRVDAEGALLFVVGPMSDNGMMGDAIAGDRVFTARVPLHEPAVGKIYFRVAAAFRGNFQKSPSTPMALDVDPFPLPPDPGEAGKQTLEGIDSDGDGVRDDIQRWIAITHSTSEKTRKGLLQKAAAFGRVLVLADNPDEAWDEVIRGTNCLFYLAGDDIHALREIRRQMDILTAMAINTDLRSSAYQKASESQYWTQADTSNLKQYCDFDPDQLAN